MESTIIRYQTHVDAADENQRLIEAFVAELASTCPSNIRYAAYRLDDGVTFVHIATVTGNADLAAFASFREFRRDLQSRVVPGSRTQQSADAIGSYAEAEDGQRAFINSPGG